MAVSTQSPLLPAHEFFLVRDRLCLVGYICLILGCTSQHDVALRLSYFSNFSFISSKECVLAFVLMTRFLIALHPVG